MRGSKKKTALKAFLCTLLLFTAVILVYQSSYYHSLDVARGIWKPNLQIEESQPITTDQNSPLIRIQACRIQAVGIAELPSEQEREKQQIDGQVSPSEPPLFEIPVVSITQPEEKPQDMPKTEQVLSNLAGQQQESETVPVKQKEAENRTYLGVFRTTFYCGENYPHICGTGNGITASGVKAQEGITVAADTRVIPMGTKIYIEGIGERIVQDRGGGIKGNKLDIFVAHHATALSNGVENCKVWIINE